VFWSFGEFKSCARWYAGEIHGYFRPSIRILKKEELNTWEKLGRPSGYFLSYLVKIDDFKLEKFTFRKQYNSLKNKEIRKRGRQLLYLQSTCLTLIIALIALMTLQFTIKN
ncbi:hypothetical protein OD774_32260, partial [Pseudomonas aeruginosa]|uniref:hypothetical protein n=1 Tax=Pseudomonas aeruginosa TaxID=287 RepID=UPI0021F23A11